MDFLTTASERFRRDLDTYLGIHSLGTHGSLLNLSGRALLAVSVSDAGEANYLVGFAWNVDCVWVRNDSVCEGKIDEVNVKRPLRQLQI